MTNVFLSMRIDPENQDLDFEKLIKQHQAKWSREASSHPNPTIKRRAQEHLSNLDQIRKVLLDPERRAQEAQKARAIIHQKRQEGRSNLEQAVQLLARGKVTDSAIMSLAGQFKKWHFDENDIRELLATASHTQTAGPDSGNGLAESVARDIRENLELVGQNTLFQFLGVPQDSTLEHITQTVDEQQQRFATLPPDPETDIRRALLALCKVVFTSEHNRKQYVVTLTAERKKPLIVGIETVCETGRVSVGHVLQLLRDCGQYDASQAETLALIRRIADQRNVPVNISRTLNFTQNVVCLCGAVNHALNEHCSRCAEPLYYSCPKCSVAVVQSDLRCECGFSARADFEKLQLCLDNGDYEAFANIWDEPVHRNLPLFSDLAVQYDRQKPRLEAARRETEKTQQRLERLKQALHRGDKQAVRNLWHPEVQKSAAGTINVAEVEAAYTPETVEAVEAIHHHDYVQVRWKIESGITEYCVCWSDERFPRQRDDGTSLKIAPGEYQRIGCRILNVPHKSIYVTVFASAEFNGSVLDSNEAGEGAHAVAKYSRRQEIHYRIVSAGLLRGNGRQLQIDPGERRLVIPELLLVARPDGIVPVDTDSGKTLLTIPSTQLAAGEVRHYPFKDGSNMRKSRYRLFCKNAQDAIRYELVDDE